MSDHEEKLSPLVGTFVALLVLTALTTWFGRLDLGAFSTAVALTIACAKALLVVIVFMHVRFESGLVRVVAGAGLLWAVFLIGLTLTDYVTRP